MTRRVLLCLFAALVPGAAQAQYVLDALKAGDLICEFRDGYRREVLADLKTLRRPADIMLIFESIKMESGPDSSGVAQTASTTTASSPAAWSTAPSGTASAFSSRTPGRRPAVVRATPNAVHFIEPVGPSVRVTTLSACEQWKFKRGVEICVRFTARHAWHFDKLVGRIPDTSFARQPSGAASGSCEPWQMN